MKLILSTRIVGKKSELTQIRFRGDIPGVVYGIDGTSQAIIVNGREWHKGLSTIQKGYVSTTRFELDLKGKTTLAIVKDIQYHPVTYAMTHIDFQQIRDESVVEINVPVTYIGEDTCVGIKQGGYLRPVKRHVKVRCSPRFIPIDFKINIQNLSIGHSKRVSDIETPPEVTVLLNPREVLAVIAKR